MNCLTVRNLISAYIDCELDPDQRRELRNHLFHCQECNQEYEQLVSIKNCLENSCQEPIDFNLLEALYARIESEKIAIIPHPNGFYWGSRILMIAACLTAFFLATFMLYPLNQKSTAQNNLSFSSTGMMDQNITIDQPVNVYQASFVLP
ncbi:MAG TPA: zf-HC2 domain-containing protein [Bacillota bacterium]|nr:zf-HC2 domain-containing protein [Bacillota bacterium]HPT88164.1 zf-HC2 domain-containing protein [Bacillota bacterium]